MTTEAPTHEEQKIAGIEASLIHAGIGKRYHRRTLGDFGDDTLKAAMTDPRHLIQDGIGWSFVGGDRAYDALVLTSRAFHLLGYQTRVATLPKLNALLNNQDDYANPRTCAVLSIPVFCDANEPPLRGWEMGAVESLINERLDENKIVCVQTANGFTGTWWSRTLQSRLANTNETLVLK